MAKQPWEKFYPRDHRTDPELSLCTPATRGIWIDWLCVMYETNRSGILTGSADDLSRLGRCNPDEAVAALEDLKQRKAAEITKDGDVYEILSRRLFRQAKSRSYNTEYQQQKRCQGNVKHDISEIRNQKSESEPPPLPPPCKTEWVRMLWNQTANSGLPRCKVWTDQHHRHALALIEQHGGKDQFRSLLEDAIAAVNESDHCNGKNDRGWRATLNFLLCMTNKKAFSNVLSGVYGSAPQQDSGTVDATWETTTPNPPSKTY